MLTQEANDRYTRVGLGTPMGELMRRYWHPIAAVSQMNDKATKKIRLLGEDLILYKDRSGMFGLVEPHCAHRRMNMIYGIPEQNGLRCPYHGWLYDATGQCIEQPYEETEDPDARFKDKIQMKAYPVEQKAGVLFAYLGPQPAPLLPNWDVYAADTAGEVGQGSTVVYTGEHGSDSRTYSVSFSRILSDLADYYRPEWNLTNGGQDLCRLFARVEFDAETFVGSTCNRLRRLEELAQTGRLADDLRRVD